ncbi:hypothetical protein R0135_15565 [Congregibacter variabilis]|uniref:Uncharacterized protein n=1 Tax=Congregibacter variabilis TaxID=3081200 RepID=A0ABZ0I298_9GAMM|nr:hypothetical protein R0135_15565 [Congregibacter sp. IMCC43200]
MIVHPDTDPKKLRNLAAIIAILSGASQCFSLWLLPTSTTLLLTALTGTLYLLLGLGLFGISRFSLFLAITLPPLRGWFGLYPLDIPAWELLRIASDLTIALLCIPSLWASLHPEYQKVEPGMKNSSDFPQPPSLTEHGGENA